MSGLKNIFKNAGLLALFLATLAAFGLVFGCPVKRVTGLPCPGCGLTRACLSLLTADFSAAMRWHPLCLMTPLLGFMFVIKDTGTGKRFWSSVPLLSALAAAIMAVYIWRMITMFPNIPPMELNQNAFIVKIVHKLLLQ